MTNFSVLRSFTSYSFTIIATIKYFCFSLIFFTTFLTQTIEAQKYAIHFKDKTGTPYQFNTPLQFLSERALERRYKFDINLSEDDLPINPQYIKQVEEKGATILLSSKWLNCVLVQCETTALIQIKELNFVDSIVFVYPHKNDVQLHEKQPIITNDKTVNKKYDPFYGNASNQIEQINGINLHKKGYDGEGILIAVLDAGFRNVNTISAFSHLFESGRVLIAKDFIDLGGDIYRTDISTHGTSVLSCMAAYLPNQMVGTAPKASYCLFRTEDVATEYLIEEYTWVIGTETADSIGADLINSSLVYTTFDEPTMSHKYSDMDGKTTIAAIGARKAVEKGIFVCTSAGNDGNNTSWNKIGTPADVASVLTVGAVQNDGKYATFSSIGPNATGEQKPNVMAQGHSSAIVNSEGQVTIGNGTSYSTPIICGMVACVIQASPFTKPELLKHTIEKTSSLYTSPSYQMGYGIPDFYKTLQSLPIIKNSKCNNILIYPNPSYNTIIVKSKHHLRKALFYDITGKLVLEKSFASYNYKIAIQELSSGIYVIHFYDDKEIIGCTTFIKQ